MLRKKKSSTQPTANRSQLILLKKILFPAVEDVMRRLTGIALNKGVWVSFAGMDALNFHFAEQYVHTHAIDLVLSKNQLASDCDFDAAQKVVMSELCNELNSYLGFIANDESNVLTRKVVEELKLSTGGDFFVPSPEGISLNTDGGILPFIRINRDDRILYNIERYGMRFLSLKDARSRLSDSADKAAFGRALRRPGLTFSHWTAETLGKECFPCLASRRFGNMQSVLEKRKQRELCTLGCSSELSKVLDIECALQGEKEQLENVNKVVELEEMIERAVQMNLLPDDPEFRDVLQNEFNTILVGEIKRE